MILLVIVTSFEMNENLKQNQSDSVKRNVLLGIVFPTIRKAKWNQKPSNLYFC